MPNPSSIPNMRLVALNAATAVEIAFPTGTSRFRLRTDDGTTDFYVSETKAKAEATDRFTIYGGEVMQESEVLNPASLWVIAAAGTPNLEVAEWI